MHLLRTSRQMFANERGIVLVVALMMLGLISALAAAYSTMIRSDTVLRGAAGRDRSGFYAAEGGLNHRMQQVKADFDNFTPPTTSSSTTITVGTGSSQRSVTSQLGPVAGQTPGAPIVIPTGQAFAGLNAIPNVYTVTSTATKNGEAEAKLGAQFQINTIPLFQFMAFSPFDLDIQNSPVMVMSGRVHTNSNLYLNTWSSLTIGDKQTAPANPFVLISASGTINRGAAVAATSCMGTVTIDTQQDVVAPTPGNLDPLDLPCAGNPSSVVTAAQIATYGGSLRAAAPQLQVPSNYIVQRGSGIYWQQADLRIVLNVETAARVTNFCGLSLANPGLYAIEVQNADGSRDTNKTNALWQFMCERRGAIFYNDIPNTSPAVPTPDPSPAMPAATNSPNATTANDPSNPDNYTPPFGDPGETPALRQAKVYRRVGEDTNGDGTVDVSGDAVISNNDRNDDICPLWIGTAATGARPTWRPDFCNVRLGAWTVGGTGNAGNRYDNIGQARTAANDIQQASPNFKPPRTSWYLDSDYRRGGFYNQREASWVRMLNVNIRALIDWNEANQSPPSATRLFPVSEGTAASTTDGGVVIFLSVQAANSTTSPPPAGVRYGVRVFDSANLNTRGSTFVRPNPADPTGLTVASDQPVIIQGNYNYSPGMPLNFRLPAAVMGDTIGALSQSWEVPLIANSTMSPERQYNNDRKSVYDRDPIRIVPLTDGYYVRNTAAPNTGVLTCASGACTSFAGTTSFGINAAFAAGTRVSTAAAYGGGLENYPRFFEGWQPGGTARTLTYAGSFITLQAPRYEAGAFQGGGSIVYDPPARNWDYDASFNDTRLLPPLTPQVNFVQQNRYTRFYQ
jgi:Tfp pilus assembly protein PilX